LHNSINLLQIDLQADFFGIYGWLVKIYGCFLATPEKRIMENLQLKLHAGFNISS